MSPYTSLPRAGALAVTRALEINPVAALMGARQTGKSTLVREQLTNVHGYQYITLDDASTLADAVRSPETVLRRAPKIIIDEVQRLPSLLLEIKMLVDAQTPRQVGQFVLTGSANLLLMKQVADSLTGRATYVTLWPMARREILGLGTTGGWSDFFTTPREQWFQMVQDSPAPAADWQDAVQQGGFPYPAYSLDSWKARRLWFESYVATYLQRDVPEIYNVASSIDLHRLMQAVAHRLGSLQNQTEIARDLGMPQPSVHRYLDLLETSYQLVRLPAYAVNRTKRLMKSPKLYWNDTALALMLSREQTPGGSHLENLVFTDLLAWRASEMPSAELMYWRTESGHEVDFVIENGPHDVLAIEVKATTRPSTKHATGIRTFMDEYGKNVRGGLLLHCGDDTFWIADGVLAVPWWRVM